MVHFCFAGPSTPATSHDKVYINEIMVDKNGGFQTIELLSKYLNVTVKIGTHKKFTVIIQKFEQGVVTIALCIQKMQTEWQTV